jgi:sphingomyelin phosphodiesterase acid-like 3
MKIAKQENESVLIAMHIPPGYNTYNNTAFWKKDYLKTFLNLINTYHKSIFAILTSHTHQDEIKIIKNKLNKNIIALYSTPALSTAYGNSPAFKSFELNKNNISEWSIKNYTTYYFKKNSNQILLNKLYSFQDYYCLNKTDNAFSRSFKASSRSSKSS